MSKGRIVVVYGQFGKAADPINLPHFKLRLDRLQFETILIQHTDTQKAFNFLHGYKGFCGLAGASLGAGVVNVMAGYLKPQIIGFVGGFQPSDFDPVMHAVELHGESMVDIITRAVDVPNNVQHSLVFRNPVIAATGGLGHATYTLAPGNRITKLEVIERVDVHPGDFGIAQDTMIQRIVDLQGGHNDDTSGI